MKKQIFSKIVSFVMLTLLMYVVTLSGSFYQLPDGAYIHIGDAALYAFALVLPLQVCIPVCVLGQILADASLGSYNYIIATMIIKALMIVAIKMIVKRSHNPLNQDCLICLSGVIMIAGYFVTDVFLAFDNQMTFVQSLAYALDPLMYNVLQALLCAVIFMLISGFIRGYTAKKQKNEQETDV